MISIQGLEAITQKYDACLLECDGMTNVLHYYLSIANIPHTVMEGSIENTGNHECMEHHWWIEANTVEGPVIVDYRARMWLGNYTTIPHGVFSKTAFRHINYSGSVMHPKILPEAVIKVLTGGI